MQAIGETLFDIVYLSGVIIMGIMMIKRSGGVLEHKLAGVMAVVLGCGDSFHLVPRAYALCTDGLENHAAALGIGKLITSVTMTVFYVLLYHVLRKRYKVEGKNALTAAVYVLAAVRIILCLFPQNEWTSPDAPLSWGIYRNIPFAILGVTIIVFAFMLANAKKGDAFRFLWLAVLLSFGFYIPVVLFADRYPMIGMLMIPKTCAYVWIVLMCRKTVLEKY